MPAKRLWLLALATITYSSRVVAQPAVQWSPVPNAEPAKTNKDPDWEATPRAATQRAVDPVWTELAPTQQDSSPVVWEPLSSDSGTVANESVAAPSEKTDPEPVFPTPTTQKEADAALKAIQQNLPSGPTFANDKALWRDGIWQPQISNTVPVGFGPKGVMATFSLAGVDCTASGVCTSPATWEEYQEQVQAFGEAQFDGSLGFGDPIKWFGLTITSSFEETKLQLGGRNTGSDTSRNLFSNYYIGLHLSRALGPDTSIRGGVKNWIDIKDCGSACGFPKSAYGVISQRIRLKNEQTGWFPNAYLTAGIGNGEFRPLDQQFSASVAAQRAAGCSTYGYQPAKPCSEETRRRAVLSAANYGQLNPIASAALEVYPGFNAISEWTGRNLSLGFSVRPFEEVGLVFTSMWNNLLPNCDWGCSVSLPDTPGGAQIPDNLITFRPVWSFNLSLEFKF